MVINLESPQTDCEKLATSKENLQKKLNFSGFTQEFIRSLPENVVKKIFKIRSDCFGNYSRDIKLLTKNNNCRVRIQELEDEVKCLNEKIEEIIADNEKSTKKNIKNAVKPLKLELNLIREAR